MLLPFHVIWDTSATVTDEGMQKLFSLDHQSKADDAPVHLFFLNVAVKVTGSENWTNAQ
jgi:hypothetical protein